MEASFEIPKLDTFCRMVEEVRTAAAIGAHDGIEEALDTWGDKAREIAQEKSGNLKRNIKPNGVKQIGDILDLQGTIRTDAIRPSKTYGTFNYAYYWHEVRPHDSHVKYSGVSQHLDVSGKANEKLLGVKIEKNIRRELKGIGW